MKAEVDAGCQVSVLMPAWNAGRWIEEAVESVLSQTFRAWELIVLLDVETRDNTAELFLKISDPRVKLVWWPHEGFVKTLNGGLRLARGKWIARLDADDVAAPNWLEAQLHLAAQDDSVVLIGGAYLEEAERNWSLVPLPLDDIVIRWRRLFGNVILHSGILYSRDTALQLGGYDASLEVAEDYDLWWRMGQVGRYGAVRDVIVRIRKHPASMSVMRRRAQLDAIVCILQREITRILGVKPESEMVRSMLHVRGWQSFYPIELPREEVWTYILELFSVFRGAAARSDERQVLDNAELGPLIKEAANVLEGGVFHQSEGTERLYLVIKSLAPHAFSMRQSLRYRVVFSLPRWSLSLVRAMFAGFRRFTKTYGWQGGAH